MKTRDNNQNISFFFQWAFAEREKNTREFVGNFLDFVLKKKEKLLLITSMQQSINYVVEPR